MNRKKLESPRLGIMLMVLAVGVLLIGVMKSIHNSRIPKLTSEGAPKREVVLPTVMPTVMTVEAKNLPEKQEEVKWISDRGARVNFVPISSNRPPSIPEPVTPAK
jgi:hypothetical protein